MHRFCVRYVSIMGCWIQPAYSLQASGSRRTAPLLTSATGSRFPALSRDPTPYIRPGPSVGPVPCCRSSAFPSRPRRQWSGPRAAAQPGTPQAPAGLLDSCLRRNDGGDRACGYGSRRWRVMSELNIDKPSCLLPGLSAIRFGRSSPFDCV